MVVQSMSCCGNMHPMTAKYIRYHLIQTNHLNINLTKFTACTEAGSRSQALYISSTYAVLDPLRKGSAAAEL